MTAAKQRTKSKRTNAQWGRDPRVKRARLVAVHHLRQCGYSYKEIAVALNTTPWPVRLLDGKANRTSLRIEP